MFCFKREKKVFIESKPSINKQINGLRMVFCFLILIYHFFFHYNGFESQGFVPNINIIWGGFFLISGLFFKCNDKKSYWKSKFEKTIIPYWISVLLIFAICFVFQKYRVGFVDLIGNLLIFPKLAFFNYVDGSHWFIVLLVYFYLVYFVIVEFCKCN